MGSDPTEGDPAGGDVPAFRDLALPLDHRIADLVARLTRDEKIGLLHQHQRPVPRLGVGPFRTGTEALHGVAWLGPATVFPQAVGLGATWDPGLVTRVGAATGTEVRALHHKDPGRVGLNVWAPVVNPLRDPRWGRNEEGYAEDPWLTGLLGTAYANGLKGDHPRVARTAPTLKHFLGYNNETDRCRTSSDLPPRVLHEYELPAFRPAIEAGAAMAVMASYNLVNGRPAHLTPLIGEHLRTWTDEHVLVVGDAMAAVNLAGDQRYLPDHPTGFGAALKAGIDCFTEDGPATESHLAGALDRGLISESDVDTAITRILAVRFRLGEFDGSEHDPYAMTTADVVNCAAHQHLAREAARKAMVLLRNENDLLPLSPGTRVAVIGPLGGAVLTDWYSGTLPYAVTAHDGLARRLAVRKAEGTDRITLRTAAGAVTDEGGVLRVADGPAAGFDVLDWGGGVRTLRAASNGRYVRAGEDGVLTADRPGPGEWVVRETFEPVGADGGLALRHVASDAYVRAGFDGVLRADATRTQASVFAVDLVKDGVAEAVAVAREADVAVVVLGDHPMVNGRETEDRADLDLPAEQEALLRSVRAANPRTVLVLAAGSPYAIGWAASHVPALLWSAHGGQEFGTALADVLLGETAEGEPVEPSGRLPQTWYGGAEDLPDLLDYDIVGSEATYLYFRGRPLFPFGHGLGYTRFEHRNLRLDAGEIDAGGEVLVSVDVLNTGERPGADVVQLYTRQRRSRVRQPLRRLRGFERVRLAPGEQTTVTFRLRAADLAFFDVTRDRPVVEAARHTIMTGRSCTDVTASAVLAVRGETIPPRTPALRAASRDDEYGTRLTDEGPERGDAVAADCAGAWLAFGATDLSGAARVTARVSAPAGGAVLHVRLDDPLSGPDLATLTAAATGHPHTYAVTTAELGERTGVRDLFLVFGTAGARVSTLVFEP